MLHCRHALLFFLAIAVSLRQQNSRSGSVNYLFIEMPLRNLTRFFEKRAQPDNTQGENRG
jgi:hypothetical protein